jgi:hypothetical protein
MLIIIFLAVVLVFVLAFMPLFMPLFVLVLVLVLVLLSVLVLVVMVVVVVVLVLVVMVVGGVGVLLACMLLLVVGAIGLHFLHRLLHVAVVVVDSFSSSSRYLLVEAHLRYLWPRLMMAMRREEMLLLLLRGWRERGRTHVQVAGLALDDLDHVHGFVVGIAHGDVVHRVQVAMHLLFGIVVVMVVMHVLVVQGAHTLHALLVVFHFLALLLWEEQRV